MTGTPKDWIPALLSVALALPLGACAMDGDEGLDEEITDEADPSGDPNGDPEADPGAIDEADWFDEGPEGENVDSDADGTVDDAIFAAPRFQLPFPCNQVWSGQTRTNHSPVNSVDFNRADDQGDSVVAAAAGRVSRVDNEGNVSYGRWIEIDHGGGFRTRYAHLSSQLVSVNQQVRQGQRIGTVGTTGGSTGPHLHYEQRLNGTAVRASFNGAGALYFGTRSYTSRNSCGGGGVTGRIDTAGPPLTVRAGASTNTAAVGSVADGSVVTIRCQKRGQSVSGTFGTSTLWDDIGNGFVADAFVSTGSDGQVAPTCN
jgi:hypothetical protein